MHATAMLTRRRFLRQAAWSALALGAAGPFMAVGTPAPAARVTTDLEFLRATACQVLASARLPAGGAIPGGAKNTTGYPLRLPGGTLTYYPAFWIRDAALMLGGDFISAEEIAGWVRVTAATQPGAEGLHFGRLRIPPFSIPDHITPGGEACWFPGAYTDQGDGTYGFLPPADDAFFFISMVHEHWRLTRRLTFFQSRVKTGWGEPPLAEVCGRAFDSVAVAAATGVVVCESADGRTRVDWGFCDAIRKSGGCLMPTLLRWRAAQELAALWQAAGKPAAAKRFRAEARKIQSAIVPTFYHELPPAGGHKSGCLLSATDCGRKDDVWAAAFAVWLGLLPREVELCVARHLLALYEAGGTVVEGQVRHLPPGGELGGHWETALCAADQYQNGGYWATPTGWLAAALRRVQPAAGDRLLSEYVAHLRANCDLGAPWEWIQPSRQSRANPRYGSSAGLVYVSLTTARRRLR